MNDETTSHAPGASSNQPAADFAKIWDEECTLIAGERGGGATPEDVKRTAWGLAFSGGGIRSATFNLGVIQALAEERLLRRFDYLSTVSGGSYIGSWLSTLIHHAARGDVKKAEELIMPPTPGARDAQRVPAHVSGGHALKEHGSIRWLRAYSNYLTPRLGLYSGDAQAAIATWLRNFSLNMTVLVALLATALLLPRALQRFGAELAQSWAELAQSWLFVVGYVIVVFVLALPAVFAVTLNLMHDTAAVRSRTSSSQPWYMRDRGLVAALIVPIMAASWLGAEFLAVVGNRNLLAWILYCAVVYFLLWVLAMPICAWRLWRQRQQAANSSAVPKDWYLWFILWAAVAGAVGGVLLRWLSGILGNLNGPAAPWLVFIFGAPLFVAVVLAVVVVHIGLMARNFDDGHHELWSRMGGMFQVAILLWLVLGSIAAFSAPVLEWLAAWAVGGGLIWLLSSVAGARLGSSAATGSAGSSGWRELVVKIAPYVFVIGFLGLVAWGIQHGFLRYGSQPGQKWYESAKCDQHRAAAPAADRDPGIYLHAPESPGAAVTTRESLAAPSALARLRGYVEYHSCVMNGVPQWSLYFMLAVMILLTLLLGWRINVNLYSIHNFYRNRLMRCYLGATNPNRKANPVTGLDPKDDLELKDLAQRPYPIINAAINLNAGRQLAWQRRRAAAFAFTPLYTGYEPASHSFDDAGYRPTPEYAVDASGKSLWVGTAVACSGAAASPNMGFHTDPAVAFLLTVFNVRVGRWCGNTADPDAWRREDPLFSLRYWMTEMAGRADTNLPFVYISDGGHFENLGIYELVRRRCPLIVACDAGADGKYFFHDLGEAIRKCYVDLGVEVTINTRPIIPGPKTARSPRNCVVGDIHYELAKDPSPMGRLIYIKASLTADLPADLLHYKSEHPDFPHQTTTDQFFDENQFESYRKLGYEAARRAISETLKDLS
jgi:hypothetical protein